MIANNSEECTLLFRTEQLLWDTGLEATKIQFAFFFFFNDVSGKTSPLKFQLIG